MDDIAENVFDNNHKECIASLKSLQKTLKENKLGSFVLEKRGNLSANVSVISCDAYDYALGKPNALNKFKGEYMNGYKWASVSIEKFYL